MITVPGLKELFTKEKLKFYILETHDVFDGILGINIMRQLNMGIDLKHGKLQTPNGEIKLKFHKSGSKNIALQQKLPKTRMEELFEDFKQIFNESEDLPFSEEIKHHIKLTDNIPTHKRQYRLPPNQSKDIQKHIQELLKSGVIRESKSPYNSPIILVKKPDDINGNKRTRLVVDFKELNKKTVDDRFPVPVIEELLDQLQGCKIFSVLDLKSGFHQVLMAEEDCEKTAFSALGNHFEFTRMPFGLKNAPATFLRLMNRAFNKWIGKCCLVYMDDIIIFSKDKEEHYEHIKIIFSILKNANMRVQKEKCKFFQKELKFLGHIISKNGISPDPEKIKAINDIQIPKTTKQIKQFLGLIGYYRKFIRNFADKTKPMSKWLKKGSVIDINNVNYKECFNNCKIMLTSKPLLEYPDFKRKFRLTTDASDHALGAVLSHDDTDNPIAFASKTLTETETKYDTTMKELLAIVWATKHFRQYLYGVKFSIYTDHKPLEWLMSCKDPNSKLTRWRIKLSEFDFEIKYKKGINNSNADALSRPEINCTTSQQEQTLLPTTTTPMDDFNTQITFLVGLQDRPDRPNRTYETTGNKTLITYQKVGYDQKSIQSIMNKIASQFKGNIAVKCNNEISKLLKNWKDTTQNTRINLCRPIERTNKTQENTLAIEPAIDRTIKQINDPVEQLKIIMDTHNEDHRGITENITKIKRKYKFGNLKEIVSEYVKRCDTCNVSKYDRSPINQELSLTRTATKPNQIIHMDTFALKNKNFLTIIDAFSRFAASYELTTRETTGIIKCLKKHFSQEGVPQEIISDGATEFTSANFAKFKEKFKFSHHVTTAKSSTGNSLVERLHSTMTELIRIKFCKNSKLTTDELIIESILSYNNTIHSATGYTPLELQRAHLIIQELPNDIDTEDLITKVRSEYNTRTQNIALHLQNKKEARINKANESKEKPVQLKVNDIIYEKIHTRDKTQPKYIKHTVESDNILTTKTNRRNVHKKNLKRHCIIPGAKQEK